jgi:hypothetical protein
VTAFVFREVWWKQVLEDPEVTGGLLTVALAISTQARGDGTHAVMSAPRLAKSLQMGESTASRHTKKLREIGYLELAERGHRRGDGTATANVYSLSLPLTQMAHREDVSTSHPGEILSTVSTSHPGEILSTVSTSQMGVSTSQNGVSTSQMGVSTSHPGESPPSFIPSISPPNPPSRARGDIDWEAAAERAWKRDAAAVKELNDLDLKKQDQQRQDENPLQPPTVGVVTQPVNEPEEPRCKTCHVVESNHDRWMESLDNGDRHSFVESVEDSTVSPDERKRSQRNYAVKNRYQDQKKPRKKP